MTGPPVRGHLVGKGFMNALRFPSLVKVYGYTLLCLITAVQSHESRVVYHLPFTNQLAGLRLGQSIAFKPLADVDQQVAGNECNLCPW